MGVKDPKEVEQERLAAERRYLEGEIERWKHRVDDLEHEKEQLLNQIRKLKHKLHEVPPRPKVQYGT